MTRPSRNGMNIFSGILGSVNQFFAEFLSKKYANRPVRAEGGASFCAVEA
jgi:hypothetical protein